MPPKKRDSENDVDKKPKAKRQKKKKEEFTDSESDGEIEQNNGNGATADEPEINYDITLEAPMLSGEIMICGGTNWDLVGRNKMPKEMTKQKLKGGPSLWRPHRISDFMDVKVRSVISGCCSAHNVLITTEGKAYSFGRNEKGQLGLGHTNRVDKPALVECLAGYNIIDASCGRNHTLFLTDKGVVYSCGDNKMGQLGLGNQTTNVASPQRISYKGPPIRKLACGAEFSLIADIRGNLYSFGCPEYGQLGHNTDGKYLVTSNKLAYRCELSPRKVQVWIEKSRDGRISPVIDVEVRDMACGINHSVVMDSKKRVFTWGFGGYGRLGHADNKDEMVPRLVKMFEGPNRGATKVAAGSTFTFGLNEYGALYLWGQTKATGEAAMYPKLVQDLSGWRVRSIGCCHKSIVICADESVVSWGASPTYGELGYGENKPKSSTVPQEVKTFDGVYVHSVSCGYGHALFIARNDSDEDRENLKKMPVYTPMA
ncbi:Protein rcc2 [Mactra antiquata]